MKDEEMADKHAEEYVMREDVITENDRVPFDNGYGFQTVSFENEVKKGCKDGFLAGLKAKTQWHILAEEPDNLPEEGQTVKVLTEEGKIEESTYFYDTYYEEFAFSNIGFLKVFAWCEIPTFDKE